MTRSSGIHNYIALTGQLRSAVGSYYASLASQAEGRYPSATERMAHLVYLQLAKVEEYRLIADFEALLSKFLPGLPQGSHIEELPSP